VLIPLEHVNLDEKREAVRAVTSETRRVELVRARKPGADSVLVKSTVLENHHRRGGTVRRTTDTTT
jgi:hypothetical protein